ncbi:MAG TPA: DNA polymerase III subunit delta [Bacteroidota bacterium]|jgi:DNA polymerase-3 subunit delta|nr:DNA polymerase III subunit delta [Bacteroidota bacterium]
MKNESTSPLVLERAIEKKDFAPIYLLYGEEELLLEETLQQLINAAVDEATGSFNLDIVYGNEIEGTRVASLASTFPMMAERRVVVVREFDKLANKDSLIPYLDRPSPSTSLVLVAAKPDFRLKFYKSVKEKGVAVEFKQLYDSDIPRWINKRVTRLGKSISVEACQLMQSYVGRSLREIQNEIDKLMIYVGERASIEVGDISALVGVSRQFNVFELQNAVGARNATRALEILEHMLDAGEQPIGIIVMLTRYVQKLWVLRDCVARGMSDQAIAGVLKISPKAAYFLEAEKRAAGKFSDSEIERCFTFLRRADERLKTSDGDAKLIMTLLLYHIVRPDVAEMAA